MHKSDDNTFADGAFFGIATAAAVVCGLLIESSGNFLDDLPVAALIVGCSLLIAGIVSVVGMFIHRFILGYNGIDTPRKIRLVLCYIGFTLLVAALLSV